MCEDACASCLKALWKETLNRSVLVSNERSEMCLLSAVRRGTAAEPAAADRSEEDV